MIFLKHVSTFSDILTLNFRLQNLAREGLIRPAIKDSSVDFPHPLGPTMLKNSPFFTEKLILHNASISPFKEWYFIETSFNFTILSTLSTSISGLY